MRLPLYNLDGEEEPMSLAKARTLLYLYVPADSPVEDIKSWLLSQDLPITKGEEAMLARVHSEDEVLRSWRVGASGQVA